jgi:hypothetical protein
MTTRDDIVRTALSFNGSCDGHGYDCQNVLSSDLGRPTEALCGRHRALRLQRRRVSDHTELVTSYQDGTLLTIGGKSGRATWTASPTTAGVHRHR